MSNDPVVQEMYDAFVEEAYLPYANSKRVPHGEDYIIPDGIREKLQGFREVLALNKHPLLYEDLKWE